MNTEMVFICAAFGACILALAGTTLYRLYRIERKRINYLFELAEERKYVHEERLNSERLRRAVEELRDGGKGLNSYWVKQLQVQNAQLQADVEDAHNSVNAHSARMWEEKFRSEESKADLYYSRVKIQERVVADLEREVKELRADLMAAQSQSANAANGVVGGCRCSFCGDCGNCYYHAPGCTCPIDTDDDAGSDDEDGEDEDD